MADPLSQFVIKPLIDIEVAGYDVSFTNSSLWMMIAVGVTVFFMALASSGRSLVPSRTQVVGEMIYEFVASMVRDNIGSRGREYFPFVFTLFIAILAGNMLGLIPYSFTFTSHLAVTGALALMVFCTVVIFGFINHGFKFLTIFVPSGVPLAFQLVIVPIELISFLIRPITLMVRLFCNMLAGHLVLKIIAGFAVSFVASLGILGYFAAMLPVLVNVAVLALEVIVSFIQAYIFAILTCVYLKDTVELHH